MPPWAPLHACLVWKYKSKQINPQTHSRSLVLDIMNCYSLLLLLYAQLAAVGLAVPVQETNSTGQELETGTEANSVEDMIDNITASQVYSGEPSADFTPFTNPNNSIETILNELALEPESAELSQRCGSIFACNSH